MAFQDEQAAVFASWEPVAVGVGVFREADPPVAAEVDTPLPLPAVFATTFPTWAQGSVGSISPPQSGILGRAGG
jgi:hypothetical protein